MDFTLDSRPESELEFFSLKLTDDILRKICHGQADLSDLTGVTVTLSPTGTNALQIGDQSFQFTRVNEAQPVDLLSFPKQKKPTARLLGSIGVKLNPKVELEASKAEAIRQHSREAEKERTARKTVELDRIPPVTPKLVKRSRSSSITSLRDFPSVATIASNTAAHTVAAAAQPIPTCCATSTASSSSISPKTPPRMCSNKVHSATVSAGTGSTKKASTVKERLNALLRKRR